MARIKSKESAASQVTAAAKHQPVTLTTPNVPVTKKNASNKPASLIQRLSEHPEWASSPNAVMLLRSQRIHATKRYGGGLKKVKDDSKPRTFTPWLARATNIRELSAILTEASEDRCLCIVRGRVIDAMVKKTLRRKEVITDAPRLWFMVDLDGFPPPTDWDWRDNLQRTAAWAICTYLPEPFHNASFHYSFSSSAGIKKGLRLHLWFFLTQPADSKTLKEYFKPIRDALLAKYNPGGLGDEDIDVMGADGKDIFPSTLDTGIYNTVQVHFTAAPEFARAQDNPLTGRARTGLVNGDGRAMTVQLPRPEAVTQTWVPTVDDLLNLIPAVLVHYPKLIAEWDGTFPGPWKKAITAFKHHLVKVLGMPDAEAFDWTEREFSKKLPGATDENRRNWDQSSIDLPSGPGGQITVWTLVQWAEAEGYQRPAGAWADSIPDAALVEDWIYVVAIKRFVNTKTLLEYDTEQFNSVFLSYFHKGQPNDLLLRNARVKTINSITYWPNRPRFVEEDASNRGGMERKLNYWNPPIIQPQQGDVKPFLDHIEYMYPGPNEADILLDYMAFLVQRPGEKVHWALLLYGCPGLGKSYLTEPLKLALGHWNVKEIPAKLLHEPFNGWQKNCGLIVVEEMMARGRLEMMNNLKPQITQPWLEVREMYKPPYWIPNRSNYLFLTNHKDAIIIDESDRRYCVLASKAPPHPDGIERYYAPLFRWTKANGPALVYWLQHRDLSRFVPQTQAPMTEGKRMMIDESLTPLEEFINRRVLNHEWPFNVDIVSPDELVEKVLPQFNLRTNPQTVGRAFANLRYTPLGERRFGEKQESGKHKQISLWAVRNGKLYKGKTTEEIRKDWMNQVNNLDLAINNREAPDLLAKPTGLSNSPAFSVVTETEPMSASNIPPRGGRSKKVN